VGISSDGVPEGPALSQAGVPSTAPEGDLGDALGSRRAVQVCWSGGLALSKWGENLGGAARLSESS